MRQNAIEARWAHVDALFAGTMELPPAAWQAWLELMEPDPAIRQRVLELLWLDAQSESVRAAGIGRRRRERSVREKVPPKDDGARADGETGAGGHGSGAASHPKGDSGASDD